MNEKIILSKTRSLTNLRLVCLQYSFFIDMFLTDSKCRLSTNLYYTLLWIVLECKLIRVTIHKNGEANSPFWSICIDVFQNQC